MRTQLFVLTILSTLTLPTVAQYTKLYDFEMLTSGANPYFATPITDGTYLYGTASNGGVNYDGTIYRIKKDGTAFTKLFDFNEDENGFVPKGSLLLIGDYLYGTTEFGGIHGNGTVFRIHTDGSDFSIIANFEMGVTGGHPKCALYFDGTYLYGTNTNGGANNSGTIFKLLPDGSEVTVIFEFLMDLTTGRSPYGHLISDGEFLYGLTTNGGAVNQGVTYKIRPDGTEYENLLEFNDDPYGSTGYGGLVYDGVEYMYAFTNNGGEFNRGTIFKIKTDGTGYIKLRDLNNDDGAQPLGSLTLVGNVLYGMTELAGSDAHGNMFSMNTDGSNFTTLIDFDGANGSLPFGGLLYDNGAFYGLTNSGGVNSGGVIFRYGDLNSAVSETDKQEPLAYPNPTHELITITADPHSMIEIYNGVGKLVKTIQTTSDFTRIRTEEFAPGTYLAQVMFGKKMTRIGFVVQ